MSEATGRTPPEAQPSLYDHAWRLHQMAPDSPLPGDGEPYPDHDEYFLRAGRARPPTDRRLHGAAAAEVLDRYFANAAASRDQLMTDLRQVYVPVHRNEHIVAAALRADRHRVRETGHWLVRHSTTRNAALVGLALLDSDWDEEDVPLIKTIGLLSDTFGALAAVALQRRRATEALLWLAQRVSGWGRVYVIEALCQSPDRDARAWLLRHACRGDFLDGYVAGQVATSAHLDEAITSSDADDDLVDHTGQLLLTMTVEGPTGMILERYPPAARVLRRHAELVADQAPSVARYLTTAMIAHQVMAGEPRRSAVLRSSADDVLARVPGSPHHGGLGLDHPRRVRPQQRVSRLSREPGRHEPPAPGVPDAGGRPRWMARMETSGARRERVPVGRQARRPVALPGRVVGALRYRHGAVAADPAQDEDVAEVEDADGSARPKLEARASMASWAEVTG